MSENEYRVDGTKPLIAGGTYSQPIGHFGTVQKVRGTDGVERTKVQWYGCREQFHNYADPLKLREYYYSHHPNRVLDVANFIYRLEKKLGLVEKTSFMYTERNSIAWVNNAPFWVENQMRHQFFTIAIRAALGWLRNANMDLRSVLLTQPYAAATKTAVDRFLSGYTRYTGSTRGWHRQFTGTDLGRLITTDELNGLLVKPKYTEEERFALIEKSAYHMWEKSGKPFGRGEEFWYAAVKEYVE